LAGFRILPLVSTLRFFALSPLTNGPIAAFWAESAASPCSLKTGPTSGTGHASRSEVREPDEARNAHLPGRLRALRRRGSPPPGGVSELNPPWKSRRVVHVLIPMCIHSELLTSHIMCICTPGASPSGRRLVDERSPPILGKPCHARRSLGTAAASMGTTCTSLPGFRLPSSSSSSLASMNSKRCACVTTREHSKNRPPMRWAFRAVPSNDCFSPDGGSYSIRWFTVRLYRSLIPSMCTFVPHLVQVQDGVDVASVEDHDKGSARLRGPALGRDRDESPPHSDETLDHSRQTFDRSFPFRTVQKTNRAALAILLYTTFRGTVNDGNAPTKQLYESLGCRPLPVFRPEVGGRFAL
jgi:hypothetical protein